MREVEIFQHPQAQDQEVLINLCLSSIGENSLQLISPLSPIKASGFITNYSHLPFENFTRLQEEKKMRLSRVLRSHELHSGNKPSSAEDTSFDIN